MLFSHIFIFKILKKKKMFNKKKIVLSYINNTDLLYIIFLKKINFNIIVLFIDLNKLNFKKKLKKIKIFFFIFKNLNLIFINYLNNNFNKIFFYKKFLLKEIVKISFYLKINYIFNNFVKNKYIKFFNPLLKIFNFKKKKYIYIYNVKIPIFLIINFINGKFKKINFVETNFYNIVCIINKICFIYNINFQNEIDSAICILKKIFLLIKKKKNLIIKLKFFYNIIKIVYCKKF